MRVRFFDRQRRVLHRLNRGCDAVVLKNVRLARVLRLEVLAEVEVADRARKPSREGARVEVLDGTDATDAITNVLPTFGNGVADGRDQPEACDDDAPFSHGTAPGSRTVFRMRYWSKTR